MAVFRINKTGNYTVMSNSHLKNKQMSLKGKGLLSLMLSLPDDWDYSIEGLIAISVEKETAIKSTLKELQQLGYIEIIKENPSLDNGGKYRYIYNIYEFPHNQGIENQGVENQPLEVQGIENQGQLNTNISNTNKSITKECKSIVEYLNQKAGTNYSYKTESTQHHINARLNEGYTVDDFKKVIDNKCKDWLNTDMSKYLRPITLFSAKFESYLNQSDNTKPKQSYCEY